MSHDTDATTTVALLGLGDAGSALATDLVSAGALVHGYDPVAPVPPGVVGCASEAAAVSGADLVISVNNAEVAVSVATAGGPALAPGALWADANSASPARKEEVAAVLPDGALVTDVALMSTVPGRGITVPMAASGPGAARFAELLEPLGASVTVVGDSLGEAAARKLLRSVFFKGLGAAVTESVTAARAAGLEAETRAEIRRELADATEALLDRLIDGSVRHAVRRSHEMAAAVEMLDRLGVPSRVAAASRDWLLQLADEAP